MEQTEEKKGLHVVADIEDLALPKLGISYQTVKDIALYSDEMDLRQMFVQLVEIFELTWNTIDPIPIRIALKGWGEAMTHKEDTSAVRKDHRLNGGSGGGPSTCCLIRRQAARQRSGQAWRDVLETPRCQLAGILMDRLILGKYCI